MRRCLAMLLFFCAVLVEARTTCAIFAKYPNKYFVESGSYRGDGIQMALDAGFKNIYSIELGLNFYKNCCVRFASRPKVKLFLGSSAEMMPVVLKNIDAPATFWLDGHYSGANTAKADTNTPILAELEAIRKHPIKTHTILIDDVRLFGTIEFDFIELQEIIQKILEINPKYQITYEDGYISNDVLVAYAPIQ